MPLPQSQDRREELAESLDKIRLEPGWELYQSAIRELASQANSRMLTEESSFHQMLRLSGEVRAYQRALDRFEELRNTLNTNGESHARRNDA
jgi:hypothetical protein